MDERGRDLRGRTDQRRRDQGRLRPYNDARTEELDESATDGSSTRHQRVKLQPHTLHVLEHQRVYMPAPVCRDYRENGAQCTRNEHDEYCGDTKVEEDVYAAWWSATVAVAGSSD